MRPQVWFEFKIGLLVVLCGLAVVTPDSAPRAQDKPQRPALPFFGDKTALLDMCGPSDDTQHVEFYVAKHGIEPAKVADNQPSTVQLEWLAESAIRSKLPGYKLGNVAGARWCTGTLLDDRHVLTAGHCFDIQDGTWGWITPYKQDAGSPRTYAEPPQLAPLMQIKFNFQLSRQTGALRTPDVYPVLRLLEWREGPAKLDFAIFEVGADPAGGFPNKKYKPAALRLTEPGTGEIIAIIQHPNGDPKKIDVGPISNLAPFQIHYGNLDTFGGSSGSGIRDAKGAVVGVHTDGGCAAGGVNRGVRNSAIANVSKLLKQMAGQ
jgi:hypothetical protein